MNTKKICIIAASLVIGGFLLFIISFVASGCNLDNLSTEKSYEQKEKTFDSPVKNIELDDSHRAILFTNSIDDKMHITYYEREDEPYIFKESNDSIKIERQDNRPWFRFIMNFNLTNPNVKIEIPTSWNMDNIRLTSSHGGICVKNNLSIKNLTLATTHSDITVSSIKSVQNLTLTTSHSDIDVNQMTVSNNLVADTSHGDINLTLNDSQESFNITADTTHGNCNVPKSASQNNAKKNMVLSSSHGDIDVQFLNH